MRNVGGLMTSNEDGEKGGISSWTLIDKRTERKEAVGSRPSKQATENRSV
jgi:hypothetical protein